MFIKGINMSRFSDFSLYNRTDELLRPAEKRLSCQFYSTVNIQLVYKRAQSEIDSYIPYSDVTTAMDAVFRLAIRTENLPGVVEMNTDVLHRLSDATERTNTSQHRFAERVFKNSNVPAQFLPRPSFSSHNDDKDGGDHPIELLRR
jgi:hypothetical protein